MAKTKIIHVRGRDISLIPDKVNDYISLTDIARYRDAERNIWDVKIIL